MKERKFKIELRQYSMLIVFVAIFLIFYFLSNGKNANAININNMVIENSYLVILALGMFFCVLIGNIDLGVGSVVALTGAISAILVVDYGAPVWVAILVALLIGALSGMFVGFFVAIFDIPPFIVTLATMLMGRGLTYTILQAQTKGPLPVAYTYIGAGFLPVVKVDFIGQQVDLVSIVVAALITIALIIWEYINIRKKKKNGIKITPKYQAFIKLFCMLGIVWFFFYKLACYNGLPFVLIIMGLLVVLYYFVITKTAVGRYVYALGGESNVEKKSELSAKKLYFWIYTNMGLLCAVAGIVLSARNASATPKAGDGFEMDVIAACYIGGAIMSGKVATITGAVAGAAIMGIVNSGMSLIGIQADIQKIVKGAVLLAAVMVDIMLKKRKNK